MSTGFELHTIVIDCDGCLTDGKKYVGLDGQRTAIAFNSRDNTAIARLIAAGYRVVIVTAARFPGIRRYWQKYNVEVFYSRDKESIEGIDWDSAVGIGDDLIDARFLRQCAWAFCPADAHPSLRAEFTPLATYGGQGIIEELELKLEGLSFSQNGTKYEYHGKVD